MRKFFYLNLFFLISYSSPAQIFGGTPPEQKWQQINTDTARIIFAPGQEERAKRVADIVHLMAREQPVSLGGQLKKIDIVLQHQTTVANGYVGLGPYRSEFFLTPDPNNFSQGSLKWEDQLATHEYRHVQQFNNFNHGLSKLMRTLFGQEGYALATNAAVPDWFFEGDAVYAETILSNQGRGRLPNFMNTYPSLWQEGKKYNWMKLRNGSLKDYVPNHYNLGYLLVNYGRQQYGENFWTKVTTDASAYKGLIYPFQAAIKRHAGVEYKKFYSDAFAYYKKMNSDMQMKSATQGTINQGTKDGIQRITKKNKQVVTNYFFPYSMDDTSLVYLKSSYRQRPAFFVKDKTGEHLIKIKDISTDEQFGYRNGRIVYAAYENDGRWNWRDYSVLKVLDVETKDQRTISTKSKYFTPDISQDGKRIVAVQNDAQGKSELHVLNAETGEVLNRIQSTDIRLFGDPKFVTDDMLVTTVRFYDGRMALASAEISRGTTKRLTPPSYNVVGYPSINEGVVYFTASYNGNDDVYALRMADEKIFKISEGPFGNYFVNANAGKLTWSTFTSDGYQLMQMDIANINWNEMPLSKADVLEEKMNVAKGKSAGDILNRIAPSNNYSISKYKKSTGLLNFHSWRPNYDDPIFTFSLYGQNVLNTLQSELYFIYNESERTSGTGFATTFGGWFPYITAGTEYTFNREETIGNRIRQWGQLDSRIGLTIPLSKTKGTSFRNFSISSFYVQRNEFSRDAFYKDSLGNTSFGYLSNGISFAQQVQRARQHIFPRLGIAMSAAFRNTVTKYDAQQFNGGATIYLPGVLRNHHLVLLGNWQERDTLGQVNLGNRFPYSRGYTGRNFSRMWRTSVNYHFPLWHMDFGFGNILYIQRIRANGFYDFTKVYSRDKTQTRNQRSAGGEVFFDTKWWNQYELTFGFRVSQLLDQDQFNGFKGTKFEFVMPLSIFPN